MMNQRRAHARVIKLAPTDPDKAVDIARQIPAGRLKCLALAYIARYAKESYVEKLAFEALAAGRKTSDPFNLACASAWPIRALIERGYRTPVDKIVRRSPQWRRLASSIQSAAWWHCFCFGRPSFLSVDRYDNGSRPSSLRHVKGRTAGRPAIGSLKRPLCWREKIRSGLEAWLAIYGLADSNVRLLEDLRMASLISRENSFTAAVQTDTRCSAQWSVDFVASPQANLYGMVGRSLCAVAFGSRCLNEFSRGPPHPTRAAFGRSGGAQPLRPLSDRRAGSAGLFAGLPGGARLAGRAVTRRPGSPYAWMRSAT